MYNAAGCGVVLEEEVILASRANASSCPLYNTVASIPKVEKRRVVGNVGKLVSIVVSAVTFFTKLFMDEI